MGRFIKIFAVVTFHWIPLILFAQQPTENFAVIITYVRGTATLEKGKQVLKEGITIHANDKITFGSDKDFIIGIHSKRGRIKIARAETAAAKKGDEDYELVARMIRLDWEMPTLGYRSAEYALLEEEIFTDANINPKLLVMPINKYLYPQSKYKVDANHFFFLQIQANGKSENERLNVSADTLLINLTNYTNLLAKTGSQDAIFYLGFFDSQQNKAITIKQILPYVDLKNESANMVGAIINALKGEKSKSEIFNECYTQLYYFLGKPCAISLINTIDFFY